jgi:VanZ family protein
MDPSPQPSAAPTPGVKPEGARRYEQIRRWVWIGLVAATIFLASSRETVATPGLPGPEDKYAHFLVYGLLATLLCRLKGGWRAAGWAVLAASLYGSSDEWHQTFVAGRDASVGDWVADTTGAALAVVLYRGVSWYRGLLESRLIGRRLP